MTNDYPTEKLLLKVFDDLSDFLPFLILVGGWIPYVYARYVWQNVPNLAVNTMDIDFGILRKKYPGKQTIASRVLQLGYGERHLSMDRLVPFVPVVKGEDDAEKAEVEFITDLKSPKDFGEKLVGSQIKINEVRHFELLFKSIRKVFVSSHSIQIPADDMFVFHKLLTFTLRENEDKLRKDLYYVYFMLRFCPDQERLMNAVKKLIKKYKEGKKILKNIQAFFEHKDDKGPVHVEREIGTDYFIKDIRKDAYERIMPLGG